MSKQNLTENFLSPNGSTKFCFLFGNALFKSPSPSLQTQWFQSKKLNSIYLPCQIQHEEIFKNTIKYLLATDNFMGANITVPFKNAALYVEDVLHSNAVKKIGAANTLYKSQTGKWCLENTDIFGIERTIANLIPPNIKYNLILYGGGGAASACMYYGEKMNKNCQEILCFTRNPIKTLENFPNLKENKKLKIHESNLKI